MIYIDDIMMGNTHAGLSLDFTQWFLHNEFVTKHVQQREIYCTLLRFGACIELLKSTTEGSGLTLPY